jgi:hypothetical protein
MKRNSTKMKKRGKILSFLAGEEGLEPPTYDFGDRRSAN